MFETETSSTGNDEANEKKYSAKQVQELQEMSRNLRRAKRKLLLKSAEAPSRPVDQLRGMLLQLSVAVADE